MLFDLDGVLIDTEPIWERVRRTFAQEHGGGWSGELQTQMMGVRTADWSTALSNITGGKIKPEVAAWEVIENLADAYRQDLPVIDGAVDAVRALAPRFRLGLASGSPPALIALTLQLMDLTDCIEVAMSADEVQNGKPMPDPISSSRAACISIPRSVSPSKTRPTASGPPRRRERTSSPSRAESIVPTPPHFALPALWCRASPS